MSGNRKSNTFAQVNRDRNFHSVKATHRIKTPRYQALSTIGRPGQDSEIILNRSDHVFYGHNGNKWVPFSTADGKNVDNGLQAADIAGNTITNNAAAGIVTGSLAVAGGNQAVASGARSTVIGSHSSSSGADSVIVGNNSSVTSSFGVVLGSGATSGIGLIAAAQLGIPIQLAGPGPVGVPAGIVEVNIDGVIYLVQLYEPP